MTRPDAPPDAVPMGATMFADLARPMGPLESVERLRILETLSYGVLYEGRIFQASRAEEVWLLELDVAFERDPETFAHVLVEFLAASRLRDATASILSPRGVFRHGESLYVLLDACTGVSLATAFEFLGRAGLRLGSEAVLRIASGVLSALDSAAREKAESEAAACHGMLTPENIFIAEAQRVLVRGFGLWPAGINRLDLLGPNERRYLAPSQNRSGVASPRTDLLSLGIVLFESVVGYPAFDAPPEEEDLSELRVSVAELQTKAEPSLWDLFEVLLACLIPPSTVTPAYRARVRKTIDTLFLREFNRDRVTKTLSLEELVVRIKPRRPAIVKATPISLAPAEAEPAANAAEVPAPKIERPEDEHASTPSPPPPFIAEPVEPPAPRAVMPVWQFGQPRRRGISRTTLAFGAAAIAVGLFGALFWSVWPRSESSPAGRSSSPEAERPVIRPAPTAAPPLTEPISKPLEVPSPVPDATVARGSEHRVTPEISRPRRVASAKGMVRRRESARQPKTAPAEAATVPAGGTPLISSGSAQGVPVPPGTLVSWNAPGLVFPVLIAQPPVPRYDESDPRPPVERTAVLEILVSDSGRVRGSRILRADRMPAGFAGNVEKYLAAMRFRPAELGGVAVKVWMPYNLKYYAP